jgi:hypothetical protein
MRTFIILRVKHILRTSNGSVEAEDDMEFLEEVAKRNQQDDAKGLDESTPWLKHHTKWQTRFKGRPLNILAISKKPPSASPKSRRRWADCGNTSRCHDTVGWTIGGKIQQRFTPDNRRPQLPSALVPRSHDA